MSRDASDVAPVRWFRRYRQTSEEFFADSSVFLGGHSEEVDLYQAESAILEHLGPFFDGKRMLDLGIGGGRTTAFFAPRVREYVGTDISSAMVDRCVSRFGTELGNASFAVADARDLSAYESASFDFILFSFNGLDCIDDEESRLQALSELQRVCTPDGFVCFSSHNLAAVGRHYRKRLPLHPVRLVKALAAHAALRVLNPSRRVLAQSPWALVRDGVFAFQLRLYYVRPSVQIAQLESLGLPHVEVVDAHGQFVPADKADEIRDITVYFLASAGG